MERVQWITLRFFRFRVAAIVIAGIVGEPIALWALYRASERPWQPPTVLVATLILLLAVAAARSAPIPIRLRNS